MRKKDLVRFEHAGDELVVRLAPADSGG